MSNPAKILFICIGNTCRSQMAEGFARRLSGGRALVRSAGTSALGVVVEDTIRTMAEKGVDISSQSSDQLTGEMMEWADMVVTLGCCSADEVCPKTFAGRKIDWPIEDPFGRSEEFYRRVRDDVETRVGGLIESLGER